MKCRQPGGAVTMSWLGLLTAVELPACTPTALVQREATRLPTWIQEAGNPSVARVAGQTAIDQWTERHVMHSWSSLLFRYTVAGNVFRPEPRGARGHMLAWEFSCVHTGGASAVYLRPGNNTVCHAGSPRALETVVSPKRLPAWPCIGHPASGSASSTEYGRGEVPDEASSAEPSQTDVGNGQPHQVQALHQAASYFPWEPIRNNAGTITQ